MKKFLLLNIWLWSSCVLLAQEMLAPLPYQPQLQQGPSRNTAKRAPLTLPFADDFNQTDVYPNNTLWEDPFVYINNTFPIMPPTVGVATFDGLNSMGKPYSDNVNSYGEADKLTSQAIDLSGLNESENIYLSFYWQAGGLGDLPNSRRDYIIVEFLNDSLQWIEQLRILAIDTVNNFQQEFLPIRAPYLHENFQFRFKAFGNLSGSANHWHIDYVLLDKNRNPSIERSVSDLAYVKGNGQYFTNYYQLPFKHFTPEMLKDTLKVVVKNNFLNIVDIVDQYSVTNVTTGELLTSYYGPSLDINSLQVSNYEYPGLDLSTLEPTSDTTIIEVRYSFNTSAENTRPAYVRANNEVVDRITFGNAFAYDDGSAERAYRLVNYDYGKIAVRFEATVPDTLRAIRMFFPYFPNYTSSAKDPFFNIVVYKSLDSITGENDEVLYRATFQKKSDLFVPEGETFNGFAYYTFDPEMNDGKDYLIVEGDFYIGIEHEKNHDVDLGFDLNTVQNLNMWYNVGYGWYRSQYPGSLMINAIMGGPLDGRFTSVKDKEWTSHVLKLYPNPVRDVLKLETDIKGEFEYKIFDLSGKMMKMGRSQQNAFINVKEWNAGMYIILTEDVNGEYKSSAKFIKL